MPALVKLSEHQQQEDVKNDEDVSQYLTFVVGGELFAVSILEVHEIIEIGAMTHVPMAPEFIRGVINLRGSVTPVIDLSARLGKDPSRITKRSCIVLIGSSLDDAENETLGMLVDEIREIIEIAEADIQPPPRLGEDISTEFIKAMVRIEELFVVLLNLDHVLSTHDFGHVSSLLQSIHGANSADESTTDG